MGEVHIQKNEEWRRAVLQPFLCYLSIGNQFHLKPDTSQCFCKNTGKILVIFNDQSRLTHTFLHCFTLSAGTTRGKVTVNRVPTSTLLVTWISPFIKLTSCLTIDRPSPNPP